jgi:hypothetical protein
MMRNILAAEGEFDRPTWKYCDNRAWDNASHVNAAASDVGENRDQPANMANPTLDFIFHRRRREIK